MIVIYTDGACIKNPGGKGGWAWAVKPEGNSMPPKVFDAGSEEITTNNIMEMTAVLEAIRYAKRANRNSPVADRIVIYSDSRYCVDGFMSWMYKWRNRGWSKPGGLKNEAIWRELWDVKEGVTLKWVRGHNGNPMNEFVDALAGQQC